MESCKTTSSRSPGSMKSVTAGREAVRADRLYVPSRAQALGKPPVCGPVNVPVVGAVRFATQSLAATPASRAQ